MKMVVTVYAIEDCGEHSLVKAQGKFVQADRWAVAAMEFRALPHIAKQYHLDQKLTVEVKLKRTR